VKEGVQACTGATHHSCNNASLRRRASSWRKASARLCRRSPLMRRSFASLCFTVACRARSAVASAPDAAFVGGRPDCPGGNALAWLPELVRSGAMHPALSSHAVPLPALQGRAKRRRNSVQVLRTLGAQLYGAPCLWLPPHPSLRRHRRDDEGRVAGNRGERKLSLGAHWIRMHGHVLWNVSLQHARFHWSDPSRSVALRRPPMVSRLEADHLHFHFVFSRHRFPSSSDTNVRWRIASSESLCAILLSVAP
jgi:hypothetical protein